MDSFNDSYSLFDASKKISSAKGSYYVLIYAEIKPDNFSIFWQAFVTFIAAGSLPSDEKELAKFTADNFQDIIKKTNAFFKAL